ncbi:MAG: iron-sulfur cluster assembly accessory protein [Verrucomicrobia bacterium]|nr:MAG: iron-sulfur cluster assembly accessory protein [Verrucomicrobiota bacterium]
MISLTTQAAKRVRELQDDLGQPEKRLRLFIESGGCSGFQYGMSYDVAKPEDSIIKSEGVELLIDPTNQTYPDGSVVELDDGLHGKGFEIMNPNAETTFGCGKSFS